MLVKEPRFVVRESSGYAMSAGPTLVTEVMVLDRAYCHRVVWSSETAVVTNTRRYFSNPKKGGPKTWRPKSWNAPARFWSLANRRAYAEAKAAELNAWDATL